MTITVDAGDGRLIEFPDVETANKYFQQKKPETGRGLGGLLYENVIGRGEVDTPGERIGQTIQEMGRAAGAGVLRGASALADLPGMVVGGAGRGVEAGLEYVGAPPEFASATREAMTAPFGEGERARGLAEEVTGGYSEYKSPTTAGQYAGTVGEFIPGALAGPGGVARNLALGVSSGLASETAGQAAEALGAGDTGQAIARTAGAFFGPVALSTGNRTVNALLKRSAEAPSLDVLRQTKNAAYAAVDDAGVAFSPEQTRNLSERIKVALAQSDFVPDVDNQTRAALSVIDRNAGKPLSLGQLDKIRQGLWKRYNAAPNEVGILDMIDEIDTAINSMPSATPLMEAARVANSRFKKAEVIERAFQKAADQTAATGSGGNILNKYRQAVTGIVNNPKQARFFSQDEIAFMRDFVRGGNAENALRLVGKLSPSGNGLMMALNLGAAAYNPAMLAATAAGAGAKSASDRMSMTAAQRMRDALATGQVPIQSPSTKAADTLRLIPGLLAQ